eukprot:GFUD01014855.1.p1 GENE.GFUD01014855.1~~GFUD01014855.1.p1  ORF type:complete len:282 (+),score=61.33 GFUD01014855.1:67-912(+)
MSILSNIHQKMLSKRKFGISCHFVSNWAFDMHVVKPEQSVVLREFIKIEPPTVSQSCSEHDLQIPGLPSWVNKTNHFGRQDNSMDSNFYDFPRLVTHIDDTATASLTQFYAQTISPESVLLDLCTSWVSHLPYSTKYSKVVGVGMNSKEMELNKSLTEYHVLDLNTTPSLSFLPDGVCDHVLCCVSVDYLIQPYKVFTEINRILKPGGTFIISFSNRCFFTKAIFAWLMTNDPYHLYIVSTYFHLTSGWSKVTVRDLSNYTSNQLTDPLYLVEGTKEANPL